MEKRYSMEQLGNKLGLGRSSISQYEANIRTPSTAVQEAMADFFNVDVDYLMGRTPIRRRIDLEGCITHEISSDDVQLIEAFKNAPTATQRAICTLLGLDGKPN